MTGSHNYSTLKKIPIVVSLKGKNKKKNQKGQKTKEPTGHTYRQGKKMERPGADCRGPKVKIAGQLGPI